VNCCALPNGIAGAAGVTEMLTNSAGVTVSEPPPEIDPTAAVTVTAPTARVLANPAVPAALLNVAIDPFDELQ
jgi:hypothetical protein